MYIGDASTSFQSCATSDDTGNLFNSGDARCDNSQLVHHYSVVDCADIPDDTVITGIDLVVDARYAGTQSFLLVNPTVELNLPTGKDQCTNGGFASFGFSNQGRCIQYVNTGN